MRTLTDHVVEGDSANHQLTIEVQDAPGSGGANHLYRISGFNSSTNGSDPMGAHGFTEQWILFQNGPIKEAGVNGVTQEALLAIVIDRLRCFQAGPYASSWNYSALSKIEDALDDLQTRTRQRLARGVEGTLTV